MDAYDRAEKERAEHRARQVRELDDVARRYHARASLMQHGVVVWFRFDAHEIRWTWNFVGKTANVEVQCASPAAMGAALAQLSRVLSDDEFEGALRAALGRTAKEQAEALTRAIEAQRVRPIRYHGD